LNVNISIGAALYPNHGNQFEQLIQHAKIALTEAKLHNHIYEFFHVSMEDKVLERLVLENDLFHALAGSEFQLVYQPQVHLKSGKIIGFEALLRWHHPVKGLINPETFIPIAEETGLIIPIGEWVLRTACRQLKEFHEQGYSSLAVAVNLSIRQFYQNNLKQIVIEVLEENRLSPQFLELEITESMMMNAEYALQTLKDLKKLGIKIAIDDFGTGYSSLSYLKSLPADRLKIDQSFIRDLPHNKDGLSVVSMIISLARYLNLEVIAEGVETSAQQEILRAKSCHQAQGYLYSRPLPPDELLKKLKNSQHSLGA
jgi:EAL domain-containing protein (putative c-di-GMP-specific phosphodiesterase class I)